MRLTDMNIDRTTYPKLDTNGSADTFPEGVTYTFVCETRVTGDIPKEESVASVVVVDLEGAKFADVLGVDFAVRYQNSGVKQYFKSQDHLREWAEENATKDNPHRVTFAQLGSTKQFLTQAEKVRQLRAFLRSNGIDPNDMEAVKEFLGEQ